MQIPALFLRNEICPGFQLLPSDLTRYPLLTYVPDMRHLSGESGDLSPRSKGRDPLVSRGRAPRTGKAIFDLQRGEVLVMPLSRPMTSIASGAAELRIRDRSGIYRALYYTKSARGIFVFHAFVKKSQTTPKHEVHLGKKRLEELLHEEA
jgi:phage-related protein